MSKIFLFLGIGLLVLGIGIRVFFDYSFLSTLFLVLGGFSKFYYLSTRIRQGNYKPGFELVLLITGLLVFFTGTYLKSHASVINAWVFMGSGILLKTSFVILFISKIKK